MNYNPMFNRYGAIGLLDEKVLNVLPSLAVRVGLNEAIVLQQLNYWLQTSKNVHEGRKWVYNTYEDWQKQFPFWSVRTVRRTFDNLEKGEFILSGNFNKLKIDRTKWYTINENKLLSLVNAVTPTCGQNGHMEVDKVDSPNGQVGHNQVDKMDTPITRDYTEITTKKKDILSGNPTTPSKIPFLEIVEYLNKKANTRYKADTKATQRVIKARFEEGFTVEDFKEVIDIKVSHWLNDESMNQYLRPQTLFGTKFESYLNQKVTKTAVGTTTTNDYFADKEFDE